MVRFNVSDVVFKMDVNFQCCVIQTNIPWHSEELLGLIIRGDGNTTRFVLSY